MLRRCIGIYSVLADTQVQESETPSSSGRKKCNRDISTIFNHLQPSTKRTTMLWWCYARKEEWKRVWGISWRGLHKQYNHSVLTSATPFWINVSARATRAQQKRRERLLMCCDAGLGVNALIVRRGGDDTPHLVVLWLILSKKTKDHIWTSWNNVNT